MKKTFLRILPLAVAVLLATSCSKDDNNDNAVVNNGQETVQTKTYPISITVNQKGLSKLSCTGAMGEALQPTFEPTDKLSIYNGETLLKELTPSTISDDGKTATFEGEIVADGIADGTELTAKIGTPLTDAITATSRENAVKSGCYQTATFPYSSTGNRISLEEQNAYIEVVWENKGNSTVEFSINSKSVSLTLNAQGQGWIVAPAGVTLTCEALGITDAKTTEKANIYGITREYTALTAFSLDKTSATINVGSTVTLTPSFTPTTATDQNVTWLSSNTKVATVANGVVTGVAEGTVTITATPADNVTAVTCTVKVIPAGYVDLGIEVDNKQVYFEQNPSSAKVSYDAISDKNTLPSPSEWSELVSKCCWKWVDADGKKGYYVFKAKSSDHGGTKSYDDENNVLENYNESSDPCIFLPFVDRGDMMEGYCFYWSSAVDGSDVTCLYFYDYDVSTDNTCPDFEQLPVCTVWRSK